MRKFKKFGLIASGIFVLIAPFKLAFSKSPNDLSQKLKGSQKKLEQNHGLISLVELEKILEEDVERLSDDEKNVLILKLLEMSNSSLLLHGSESILNKDYIDAKGSFSFKG